MKYNSILLFFPIGWSFVTGSPYLSIPLLKAYIEQFGYNVIQQDLNKDFALYIKTNISITEIAKSITNGIGLLNELYFREEDKLNNFAKKYEGSWNLQLGFEYNNYSPSKSKDVRTAMSIVSPFDKFYLEVIIPNIEKSDTNIIAFSVTEQNQMIPTFRLVYLLRQKGYDGKIILGGNLITRLDEELRQLWLFEFVDFLIVFQGELSFFMLLEYFNKKIEIENVPSLIWKNSIDNKIVRNRDLVKNEQNSNQIPAPNFDGLKLSKYWGKNYLPLVHYRGCYFGKCPFCPIPYGWGFNGFAGANTVKKLFSDMVVLKSKYDINRFQMVDEAFSTISAIELAKLILSEKKYFEWIIYSRIEKKWADIDVLKLLAKAGLKKIHLGLEIISTKNRIALHKNDNSKLITKILYLAKSTGIKVHLFLLFGYSGTDYFDAEETIKFILKNNELIDTVDINSYEYYKHTSAEGIEKKHNNSEDWTLRYDYIRNQDNLTNFDIEEMTTYFENVIWEKHPLLLHPIYRLQSPWSYECS